MDIGKLDSDGNPSNNAKDLIKDHFVYSHTIYTNYDIGRDSSEVDII